MGNMAKKKPVVLSSLRITQIFLSARLFSEKKYKSTFLRTLFVLLHPKYIP